MRPILLLLLLPLTALAQVPYEDGVCTLDTTAGPAEVVCTLVAQPPPPPNPPTDVRIIAIGDSWVDRFSGSCTEPFAPMWPEVLAELEEVEYAIYGRCGAWTDEIDDWADQYLASGPQAEDRVFYYFLPNDFNALPEPSSIPPSQQEVDAILAGIPPILDSIEANLTVTFGKLAQLDFRPLTLPKGEQIPVMVQFGQVMCSRLGCVPADFANQFIGAINARIVAAAFASGVTVYDMQPYFNSDPPGWYPKGKHFDGQTNARIAAHLASVFF